MARLLKIEYYLHRSYLNLVYKPTTNR
ncbi:Protein of unknown function [Pyronema omphalodes CBS 100304]|uniref:Uncharacterized protein n=1 Tax=Pyronema omphalodes (strain CBS 100304) TaxID=1076935 RepID=U4LJ99_PYROM|nr:Protein of unknown function [Pyronema omphalodes CBS 100304]